MPKSESALAEAAGAFDAELTTYGRLGKLFVETSLGSVKHLERANQVLGEIAASEERLQTAGQHLAQALGAVRSRQEQLAAEVVARVPPLQARNQRLQQLMTDLGAVAGEVSGLNALIAANGAGAEAESPPTAVGQGGLITISQTVLALSVKANDIAASAHTAEFEEVATQAHSLHQRLQAIGKQLQRAGGGVEA